MLRAGLVSITFRQLTPEEIIRLSGEAKLQSIEWGGDVHVPPGDLKRTREIGDRTRDAGLSVAAYGSYYRLGENNAAPFEQVLAAAESLGAPTIRVWAGNKNSADCSPAERQTIIEDGLRIANEASARGITISLEYHGGTLTDARASIQALLRELEHPDVEFLWQPVPGEPVESNLLRLGDVLPRLRNIHVFHWWPTARGRHPLAIGESDWLSYIEIVRHSGKSVDFLLEYVRGDSTAQLMEDAVTLRGFLR